MKNAEMTVKAEAVEERKTLAGESTEKAKELKLEGTPETVEQSSAPSEQSEAEASTAQSAPASIEEVIMLAKALGLENKTTAVADLYSIYKDGQSEQLRITSATDIQRKVTRLFADLAEIQAISIENPADVLDRIAELK